LFILQYFLNCFYFRGHQKGAHLWQRGAIQGGATEVWGEVAPNCPPLDPPLIVGPGQSMENGCDNCSGSKTVIIILICAMRIFSNY